MIKIFENLPIWLVKPGSEIEKLCTAFQTFFERLETWMLQPLDEMDPKICSRLAVEYHAWERSIIRVPGEPIEIWRNRVDSALETYQQAGSTRGLKVILQMHGATNYLVQERQAGMDWDIITVQIDPDELSINANVLLAILGIWGKLCRRYELAMMGPIDFDLSLSASAQGEACHTISDLVAEIGPEEFTAQGWLGGSIEQACLEILPDLIFESSMEVEDPLFLLSGQPEHHMLEIATN